MSSHESSYVSSGGGGGGGDSEDGTSNSLSNDTVDSDFFLDTSLDSSSSYAISEEAFSLSVSLRRMALDVGARVEDGGTIIVEFDLAAGLTLEQLRRFGVLQHFPADADNIKRLMDMGFPRIQAVAALQATEGCVERAIQWLFSDDTKLPSASAAVESIEEESSKVLIRIHFHGVQPEVLVSGFGAQRCFFIHVWLSAVVTTKMKDDMESSNKGENPFRRLLDFLAIRLKHIQDYCSFCHQKRSCLDKDCKHLLFCDTCCHPTCDFRWRDQFERDFVLLATQIHHPSVSDELLARFMSLEDASMARIHGRCALMGKITGKRVVTCPFGVYLFKRLLDEHQQINIMRTCTDVARNQQGSNFGHQFKRWFHQDKETPTTPSWVSALTYGWTAPPTDDEYRPDDLFQLVSDTCTAAVLKQGAKKNQLTLPEEFRIPADFKPEAIASIMYSQGATLHSHQDGAQGFVLGFSFGSSCTFRYNDVVDTGEENGGISMLLESGDAVLFNGGRLFHEVTEIFPPNTAPAYFNAAANELMGNEGPPVAWPARFNLQFRTPYFKQRQ